MVFKYFKSRQKETLQIYYKVLVLAGMVLFTFILGTVGYSLANHISLPDGLILTIETLAFANVHQEGWGRMVQLLLQLFGVLVFWFVVWTFGDLVLAGNIGEWIREVRINMREQSLKNHFIICGAGRVGIHVAELLDEKHEPFVILEKSVDLTAKLRKRNWVVIQGDVLDEELLEDAGIRHAKAIVGAVPETEKNVMLTLLAKQMNPNIHVYARAEKSEFVKQLHTAGARHVVMPEMAGARDIIAAIEKDK